MYIYNDLTDCSTSITHLLSQELSVYATTATGNKTFRVIEHPSFAIAFGTNLVTATFSNGTAHCYLNVPDLSNYTFEACSITQGVPSTPNAYLKYTSIYGAQIEFYIGGGPSSGTGYPPICCIAFYKKSS
jgi:hypothetical protein